MDRIYKSEHIITIQSWNNVSFLAAQIEGAIGLEYVKPGSNNITRIWQNYINSYSWNEDGNWRNMSCNNMTRGELEKKIWKDRKAINHIFRLVEGFTYRT